MPTIDETVYPRMKSRLSQKELTKWYTPTQTELNFALEHTRSPTATIGLLVTLKCFQRLGRFIPINNVPKSIIIHIAKYLKYPSIPHSIYQYQRSGTRVRHLQAIRQFLNVKKFDSSGQQYTNKIAGTMATTKNILEDLINAIIEDLIRQNYELPHFKTLLKIARNARNKINQTCYHNIYNSLNDTAKKQITYILTSPTTQNASLWDQIKREPKKPTIKKIYQFIKHLQ